MRFFIVVLSFILGFVLVTSVPAHEARSKNNGEQLAISLATDKQGKLWRVAINDGYVVVSSSKDFGQTFSKPIRVNAEKQNLSAKGEVRPKIALGPQGEVYVAWMQNLSKKFAGHVWFARSLNNGKSFQKPMIVHQDRSEIGHAFEEISVSPEGQITMLWLDARDLVADKKAERKRTGSSVYYATSSDRGESFTPEAKLADYSCECCRIATTAKPDGTVVAMWRHVFEGGERDHMITEVPKLGEKAYLKRATFGHWKIDGCPHHGGAIASGGEGADWWGYHMAYFDGKDKSPGLYYGRMDGVAWVGTPPKQFGNPAKQARHPAILAIGGHVWLAWLETHENNSKKMMTMTSIDGGKTWSDELELLSVDGQVDYPQLLKFKDDAYLVVNTNGGLKVKAL
ncbi:MAG: sialidase family protein [Methylophilaceae bacterium]